MRTIDKKAQIYRTLAKMRKSQKKKEELVTYMKTHAPHLLWSIYRSERIQECCNIIRFEDYAEWKTRLVKANFCKYDKFCLACATRRSILKIQEFIDWIQRLELEKKYRYHVVLTVKHRKWQPLSEVMDKLYNAKKQMSQRLRNSKRKIHKNKSFFHQFDWMISSVEVSYSNVNGRHPHIHMIWCSSTPIQTEKSEFLKTQSNKELQKEWYDITGDSFCVAMRPIDVSKNHYERTGIAEVFKYAIKFSQLDVPQLAHLIDIQKKRQYRFYASYGCFRGVFGKQNKSLEWLWKATKVGDPSSFFQYDIDKWAYISLK